MTNISIRKVTRHAMNNCDLICLSEYPFSVTGVLIDESFGMRRVWIYGTASSVVHSAYARLQLGQLGSRSDGVTSVWFTTTATYCVDSLTLTIPTENKFIDYESSMWMRPDPPMCLQLRWSLRGGAQKPPIVPLQVRQDTSTPLARVRIVTP